MSGELESTPAEQADRWLANVQRRIDRAVESLAGLMAERDEAERARRQAELDPEVPRVPLDRISDERVRPHEWESDGWHAAFDTNVTDASTGERVVIRLGVLHGDGAAAFGVDVNGHLYFLSQEQLAGFLMSWAGVVEEFNERRREHSGDEDRPE